MTHAETPWRTGHHPVDEPGPRQRTIYDAAGELVGVMFTTEGARKAVDAVNDLEALLAELRQALYLTPLDEVMGRGVMADQVPAIAEALRAAQAKREGARG